jgi:hypothetical protein
MIDLFKSKRGSSVLGLALDGNRLEAVVLRRSNGTLQVRQTVSASLALSPLTDDPELAGREIRNHLDAAGIREKRCAVCLPPSWLLTLQSKMPELPEADRAGFLQLEAERGFHGGPESLFTVHSIFLAAANEHYATLMAVPRSNLSTLERVLRAAKLKPVTFGLGISAVQPAAGDTHRVITLLVRSSAIDLQVSGGGGIVALRSLDGAIEAQGAVKRISSELISREIRITLGQLPGALAEGPGKIRIVGQGEMTRQFVHEISPRLAAMGLTVESSEKASNASFDKALPADLAASGAVALAAAWVRGADTMPEFLPPKVQPWQQWMSKGMSTRRLIWAGEAAGAVIACVVIAFGVQQWQLYGLRSQWGKLQPKVNELTAMQDRINQFRGYYQQGASVVSIWAKLAATMPKDGSVSLKTMEVRDESPVTVTCTGVAWDSDSFGKVFTQLGEDSTNIANVHPEVKAAQNTTSETADDFGGGGDGGGGRRGGRGGGGGGRGARPVQFTLTFQWLGGASHGN